MDKDQERSFLETLARALVSLPFDLKVLLEAVSDPDLEHDVREIAAAAVVYIISPREGNVEPYPALRRGCHHASPGGQARARQRRRERAAFRQRFAEELRSL